MRVRVLMVLFFLAQSVQGRDSVVGQSREREGIVKVGGGRLPTAVLAELLSIVQSVIHDVEIAHLVFRVRTAQHKSRMKPRMCHYRHS